jgi:hypothetical protein
MALSQLLFSLVYPIYVQTKFILVVRMFQLSSSGQNILRRKTPGWLGQLTNERK